MARSSAKPNHPPQTERERAWLTEIATYFREKRLAAGVSIEALAQSLNPEDPTQMAERLRACEAGTETLALDEVFAITNTLNLPPEEIVILISKTFKTP